MQFGSLPSRGLFTRREGYPSKRVKVSSGLQANFTGRVTLSLGSTSRALLKCFVMCDILCNVQDLKANLKFSMENRRGFNNII